MAGTAENLARKFEISREAQDQYALRSQQEAKRALDAGVFKDEIVPVEIKTRKGTTLFDQGRSSASGNNRWKVWRNCGRLSARTVSSLPEMHPVSWTVGRRW
jgi:hypothetical protein